MKSRCESAIIVIPLVMIASLLIGNQAESQDIDWTNVSNTNSYWHIGSNWSPFGPPGSTEKARFGTDATYEVWADSPMGTIGFLQVFGGDVTFLNQVSSTQHRLAITGSGGGGAYSDFSITGATTSLTIRGLHLTSFGGAEIINGASLTLDGSHSAGAMLTVVGAIGLDVSGTLDVHSGGVISNTTAYVGRSGSAGTATVSGIGSQWNNSSELWIGVDGGNGSLNVEAGGVVTNSRGLLGVGSSSNGTATVTGIGSQWNNSSDLWVGVDGNGSLNVAAGGVVTNSSGRLGVSSSSNGTATVTGFGSQWNNSSDLWVGYLGDGRLNVEEGGLVVDNVGLVGGQHDSIGTAIVTGAGSHWFNSSTLYVGFVGDGTLDILAGGVVNSSGTQIGYDSRSIGVVTVGGTDSQFNTDNALTVGYFSDATLTVKAEAVATDVTGYIAYGTGSTGTVTVTGTGSQWNNSSSLYIGGNSSAVGGAGTLNINDNGLVTVGETTKIWLTGTVNLDGGRFEFGNTSVSEFNTINAVSGSMAGILNHTGFTDVSTFTNLQKNAVDVSDVTLINSGTLYGNASLGNVLINSTTGELQTTSGQQMRFAGSGNTNAGEINNFGGIVRFEQDLTNQSGGFINGRGQFIANGGLTNEGVMAFSGGNTDILGDVSNLAGGKIVTSGNATTTFFDDVVHNGTEIRTAAGSISVFFGAVSGAGDFTGSGTTFFEGDLRPGNSPDVVSFEGTVVLGSLTGMFVELAGYEFGEFDQLDIAGDLFLNGELIVDLIDGYQLAANQEFLIANVNGDLFGQFTRLGENDLVGNYGGRELFITYSAGSGNDVALFSRAVPEPGTCGFCLVAGIGLLMVRRRRR